MGLKKLVSYGIFVLVFVIGFGFTSIARGFDYPPPTPKIEFAQETSDLMLYTLFAALTQEFDETTVDNVEQVDTPRPKGVQPGYPQVRFVLEKPSFSGGIPGFSRVTLIGLSPHFNPLLMTT